MRRVGPLSDGAALVAVLLGLAPRRRSGARGRDGNRRGRHTLFRDVDALALTDEGDT